MRYYTSSSDYGSLTNMDPRHNHSSFSNPYIVIYYDGAITG